MRTKTNAKRLSAERRPGGTRLAFCAALATALLATGIILPGTAAGDEIPKSNMTAEAGSTSWGNVGDMIDGDVSADWADDSNGGVGNWLRIDMGESYNVTNFAYRQDSAWNYCENYLLFVSDTKGPDNNSGVLTETQATNYWGTAVMDGTFPSGTGTYYANPTAGTGRYVILYFKSVYSDWSGGWEIWLYGGASASPPCVTNQTVANVTTNSAVFAGHVITGGSATAVCVLWGTSDGGTNWGAWANTNWWPAGAWTSDSYPGTNITGLSENTTYYYTFGASGAGADVVAASSVSFRTRGPRGAWWQSPVLKYKEDTGAELIAGGPHYINKDESDQWLFFPSGFYPNEKVVLYNMQELVRATSAGEVAPMVSAAAEDFYGSGCWNDAWRGGGVSDDLGRILPGNFMTNRNTSLPIGAVWENNVNVFTITNDGPSMAISALDFSHDSSTLYSSLYREAPDADTGNLYAWNVADLRNNGMGLTSNAVYATTLSYIANPSVYHIGGKDLIYYGEGDGGGTVCVYDPEAATETVLIAGSLPSGSPSFGIENVKVGGVSSGQMHLYVQCDGGSVYIYDLSADGKAVGACLRAFTAANMRSILGASWPNMRAFEVTDDETHAFFSHHHYASYQNAQLYVVWSGIAVQNQPASDITTNSATFNGHVAGAGSSATAVCVLWGQSDGGTNWGAWANTNWWPAGAWTNNTSPSTNITGLSAGTTYYYTFGGTNEGGSGIATSPVSFTTLEASDGPLFMVE